MRPLHVCVVTALMLLASAKAAGNSIGGAWEGKSDGRKAVTLQIQDDGAVRGTAVFYITDDNGDGSHNGDALPPLEMKNASWDGSTLHFTLDAEGTSIIFVMKITGNGRAELHYRRGEQERETVIPLAAIR